MPHFFINSKDVIDKTITITEEGTFCHLAKSLRVKPGETVLLIDENKIQYETIVETISKNEIVVNIQKSYPSTRFLDFDLYLAQSPLRNSDSQSIIVEKATELGIKGLYPIFTDNCVVSKSVLEKKIPKWQKIMFESSKQCERADIPHCFEVSKVDELIENNKFDKVIVFCERIAQKTLRDSFMDNPIKKGEKVLVVIGPEGGFSANEFEYFKNKNLEMLTLGSLILRAETAVVVGLGNIIYEYTNQNKK